MDAMGRGDVHGGGGSDTKVRREQELRIRAEQEQARLIAVNHDLTLQLNRIKEEGEEELHETKTKVNFLSSSSSINSSFIFFYIILFPPLYYYFVS